MAEITACLLPPAALPGFWAYLVPHIEAALARGAGEYALEDVERLCARGAWLVWVATRPGEVVAMAMTEIHDYPRARILFVQLAGGAEGEGLTAMWPMVRTWAQRAGCSAMRLVGRPGWLRSGFIPASAGPRVTQHTVVVPIGDDE